MQKIIAFETPLPRGCVRKYAMALYLGIDAGGTRTTCAISNGQKIVARSSAATIKIKKVGADAAFAALSEAISMALKAAEARPAQIVSSCVGVAGASIPEVVEWTTRSMRQLLPGSLRVVLDTDIAHEAAFDDGVGVLVIAGTGSNVYGKNEHGTVARAGGWGPMISDEGSGYWIGRRAVTAAMRAFDSGENTALLSKIMEGWRVATRDALVSIANTTPPPDFSALVPQVLDCAEEGDALAKEVLASAGTELAQLAKIVIRRLWFTRGRPKVAVCGGVFTNSMIVRQIFFNSLRAEWPEIQINPEPVDPILGAISRAIKEAQKMNDRPAKTAML